MNIPVPTSAERILESKRLEIIGFKGRALRFQQQFAEQQATHKYDAGILRSNSLSESAQTLKRLTADKRLLLPDAPTLIFRNLPPETNRCQPIDNQPFQMSMNAIAPTERAVLPVTTPQPQKQLEQQENHQPLATGPKIPFRSLTPSELHNQSLTASTAILVFREGTVTTGRVSSS